MKERFFSLDALRAISLFLLFAYHSALSKIYPYPLWLVQTFLLTAFFMISGILFEKSRKKYSFKEFAKNKFFRLYVPFIFALFIVFVFSLYLNYNINEMAILYHASLLSIFHILQEGNLNLFHLWYIVHLLLYYFIFFLLFHYVNSEKRRFVFVSTIFFGLVFLWTINSPLRLEWKFFFFIWAFYSGCLLGKGNRLKNIYKFSSIKWLSLITIISIFTTFNVQYFDKISLAEEFANTAIYIIINSFFAISLCLLALSILGNIKNRYAERISFFISYGSVFIYLSQPLFSQIISCFFDIKCSVWVLGVYETLIVLPLSFLICVIFSYKMQRFYDSILEKLHK